MCLAYDRLVDQQCDLFTLDLARHNSQKPFLPIKNTSLMSNNELWYHVAATSKLYLDLKRPIPKSARDWARAQVTNLEALSFLDPDAFSKIPMLKLVTAYGIYYGVHGQLEAFYLSTDRLNYDNVASVAKRMCVVLSMRDYIDRHWDELIVEGVTQKGPRLRRGDFGVSCSFTTLGSYVPGVDTNKLTAELYTPEESPHRPFVDTHPFNFVIDVEEDPVYDPSSPASEDPGPIGPIAPPPQLKSLPVSKRKRSHPPSPSSYPSPFVPP